MTNKKIGLFGFGTVGKGLYDVLKKTPLGLTIKKVCIRQLHKERNVQDLIFTSNADELLDDPAIDIIVELIDDADAAFLIVKKAMVKGKAVVSANKKMIAEHFLELYELQLQYRTPFLYEGACCAGIPVIRNLEEYYDNDMLSSIRGIINGSTNFILGETENNLSFSEALLKAQHAGFAESNPVLDTEGYDALNKLLILTAHSFGSIISDNNILFSGITSVSENDIQYAREKGLKIKLVAEVRKLSNGELAVFVMPSFVVKEDELYNVSGVFNGLIIESCFADRHFFKGKGAGAFPTAAAVISDLAALRYNYKYEYKKICALPQSKVSEKYYLKIFVSAPSIENIAIEQFEWMEESHSGTTRSWVTGIIAHSVLLKSTWWKQKDISLILCPDPVIEDVSYRRIRKKSLKLAGVE